MDIQYVHRFGQADEAAVNNDWFGS